MRRRAPLLLMLLASAALCLLLWDTVVRPALQTHDDDERAAASWLDEAARRGLGADADGPDGPSLSARGSADAGVRRGAGGGDRGGAWDASALAKAAAGGVGGEVPFEGRVVDADGRPVAGARILLSGNGGTETLVADDDGRFSARHAAGRYELRVRGEDGGLYLPNWILDGRAEAALEFKLKDYGSVRVILSRGEQTLAGVDVLLRVSTGKFAHATPSDSSGTARFDDVIPYRYEVLADVPDGPRAQASTYVPPGGETVVKLEVPEGVLFRGTVRSGPDGPGVEGARVDLVTGGRRPRTPDFEATFETGPGGRFEVMVPRGWPKSILVSADGHAPWPERRQRRKVLLSLRRLAGKKPVTRDVVLTSGTGLGGRVQTAEGQPIAEVHLRFITRGSQEVEAVSDADGVYAIDHLHPGRYDLRILTPGLFPARGQATRVTLPRGAKEPTAFDLVLDASRRVGGVVVDAAGVPVVGARVWILGGGRPMRSARGTGRDLEAFTGPGGRWLIADVPQEGGFVVRATMGDLEADPAAVGVGDDATSLRLVLQAGATLAGRVTDLRTREPLVRVRVVVRPAPFDGRNARTARTNREGVFRIERLLPGPYKVTPSLRDYLPAETAEVSLVRDTESSLDLSLDPGAVFAGTVEDDQGAPIRGARVRVSGTHSEDGKRVSRAALTDARGTFRLTGFRIGVYEVHVSRAGYQPAKTAAMRGGDDRLTIVLERRQGR